MNLRCIVFLILTLVPVAGLADGLPKPTSDYITDLADLLPPEVEERITASLLAGRAETGVHVTILTLDALSNHGGAGQRIEDYAKSVFNDWGIGDARRHDGVLILVARDDRKVRIALGSGYDAVYDGRAQRVIDTTLLPAFRDNNYAGGLEAGAKAALERIARPYHAGLPLTDETAGAPPTLLPNWIFALVALAGGGLIAFRKRIGDALISWQGCPKCGLRRLTRRREVIRAATADSQGEGVLHTRCTACDHDAQRPFTIPVRRKSSGRGGGGFGGGRSSGGGATGRW